MFILMMCSALLGVGLGLRYRVLVLPPAIFAGLTILTIAGGVENSRPSEIVLNIIVFAALLQLGFVVGAYVKSYPTPARDRAQASLLAGLRPR